MQNISAAQQDKKVAGSFRDPSGFLFYRSGAMYRQVNHLYKENYDHLMSSGLYSALVSANLLVSHREVPISGFESDTVYKIIQPEFIPFISYPYEWCFSQLKAAALATLKIQKIALEHGMSLKDSSAYNIQFRDGEALLIDTLSFEKYTDGEVWVAYRQFCQHFLTPLALMSYVDVRLNQLLRVHMDGIPLDLASQLLPLRSYLRPFLFIHLHLHAKVQKSFSSKTVNTGSNKSKLFSMRALIDNLETIVRNMKWRDHDTEWGNYYEETNYSSDSFEHKRKVLSDFLDVISPKTVWDCGANRGEFSRVASSRGIQTIAFDIDPVAVEKNYLEVVRGKEKNLLPLLLDLVNPSPSIGWENRERDSLIERGPTDTIVALALVHHLAISNNVPLERIANFLAKSCRHLIIEFVPKEDSQVQRLLATRKDIFPDYTKEGFEQKFSQFFAIKQSVSIKHSERTLYLMEKIIT